MTAEKHTIGQLSRATGCKIPTIRYYERIGMLPEPDRTAGNTRLYAFNDVSRLSFIRCCSELGFSQAAIRELLDLTDHPDASCEAVTQIAQTHLEDINRRIDRLSTMKAELEQMVASCRGGRMAQCRIIERLAEQVFEPILCVGS